MLAYIILCLYLYFSVREYTPLMLAYIILCLYLYFSVRV